MQVGRHICESSTCMPFTFAHPAAVLPLRRFRFLLTVPLVIGSLVPDVPYYFPHRLGRLLSETHTLSGSIVICLPLGVALLVVTLLLREPLTVLLSARTRSVCLDSIERLARRPLHWPLGLLSILIGTWTHIAWDSLTHSDGWTTERVSALSAPITLFGWHTEMNHLLQYLSSAFGLLVVVFWFHGLLARAPRPIGAELLPLPVRRLVLLLVGVTALAIGGWAVWRQWYFTSYYHLGYLLLTRTIAWFALLYLMTGLVVVFNRRALPEPVS